MPADEFGLLKNVFGVEDQPAAEEPQRTLVEVEEEHRRITQPHIAMQVPDEKVATAFDCLVQNEAAFADYLRTNVVDVIDEERSLRREQMDLEHAAYNREDHPHQRNALGPLTIQAGAGQKVEVIQPQLIQLTPDRIVNVRSILRATYQDYCKAVCISWLQEDGRAETEHFDDPNRQLWQQLERAANPAIVISSPNTFPAISDEQRQRVAKLSRNARHPRT